MFDILEIAAVCFFVGLEAATGTKASARAAYKACNRVTSAAWIATVTAEIVSHCGWMNQEERRKSATYKTKSVFFFCVPLDLYRKRRKITHNNTLVLGLIATLLQT
jgi:hypothetical protein